MKYKIAYDDNNSMPILVALCLYSYRTIIVIQGILIASNIMKKVIDW